MAGRVIPMFTNGGVPGARAAKHPLIENAALGLVLVLTIVDVIGLHGPVLVALTGAACLVHLVRWTLWQPWKTLRVPLVWILHLAYFWLPVHFALRAFAELGIVSSSEATHALTAGAIGALVIGMMTRTSRGHPRDRSAQIALTRRATSLSAWAVWCVLAPPCWRTS